MIQKDKIVLFVEHYKGFKMKICLSVLFLLAAEGVFASQDSEAVRNALVGRLERLSTRPSGKI
jgi:hypothetical protein